MSRLLPWVAGLEWHVQHGSFDQAIYDYYNAHDGRIEQDGQIVHYYGLEPIINLGNANDIVFSFFASISICSISRSVTRAHQSRS